MPRTFVALLLDDEVRENVAAEIERLRPLSRAVAWVPRQNLHLTLRFLGEQPEPALEEVRGAMDEAARHSIPFDLNLHGLGAFPGLERPRILWIGVAEGGAEARALQDRLEAALERRGHAREARPWHAHLTIGRIFDPARWRREAGPELRQALMQASHRRFGCLRVGAISLMRSDLHPSGARYSQMSAVSLEAQ
jgi:2'-5' RNA ligase